MNLVLQGAALAPDELSQVAALAGANHIVTLGPQAWRLTGVREAPVEAFCAERGLDWAWVPDERRLADLRLLALDMDSTLITMESIDEMGAELGLREPIAAITEQAMRGEIDYAQSLRRRVALLAGLDEAALARILEGRLRLSPGGEALIGACRARGIRTLLVSGGFTYFASRVAARLAIDEVLANELEIEGGRLTGGILGEVVDGRAKAKKLAAATQALGAGRWQTVAIGDGANDIPMFAAAGTSIAWRARPAVRERATHCLDHCALDGVLNLFL